MNTGFAAAPLGPAGIAASVAVANIVVIAILLVVIRWLRRTPAPVREQSAGARNVVRLDRLGHVEPSTADVPPCAVIARLTVVEGAEPVSPVTRRPSAWFRVELDRITSGLDGRRVHRGSAT